MHGNLLLPIYKTLRRGVNRKGVRTHPSPRGDATVLKSRFDKLIHHCECSKQAINNIDLDFEIFGGIARHIIHYRRPVIIILRTYIKTWNPGRAVKPHRYSEYSIKIHCAFIFKIILYFAMRRTFIAKICNVNIASVATAIDIANSNKTIHRSSMAYNSEFIYILCSQWRIQGGHRGPWVPPNDGQIFFHT